MKAYEVGCCRLCGDTGLETVFDLGLQALCTRFPGAGEPDADRVPLTLQQCPACGLVQLAHNFDFDELYGPGYGYRSGINQTMDDHLGGIVRQLQEMVAPERGDTILDIASNDGTLLKHYVVPGINRVGIDPTIAQYGEYYEADIHKHAGFFSADVFRSVSPTPEARLVSSIAMFYDVPDPGAFVGDVSSILSQDGVWVMEQSYLPLLLKGNAFDSICHEHLCYFGLRQIRRAVEAHGLHMLKAEHNGMNGGSIRVFIGHAGGPHIVDRESIAAIERMEEGMNISDPETFKRFDATVRGIGVQLKAVLEKAKADGKTVHIYGASTKGNVLLQTFGIGTDLIAAAADRNPRKYGARTPGTGIPIISERESRAAHPDYFLVLPYHFRDEFVEREKDFIDGGGRLIFPLPEVEVYPAARRR